MEILTIKLELKGSKPLIYRRLKIKSNMSMSDFNELLAFAMPWPKPRLHSWEYGRPYWGRHDEQEFLDEQNTSFAELVKMAEGGGISYFYGAKEYWCIRIKVEKTEPPVERESYPSLINAKRACPPVSIKGINEYYRVVNQVLTNPKHPQYTAYKENFPENFDPNELDVDALKKQVSDFG